MQLVNRLKIVLAEKNITNKWLAGQLNKSVITISRWSQNKSQPSLEQLREIAKVLNRVCWINSQSHVEGSRRTPSLWQWRWEFAIFRLGQDKVPLGTSSRFWRSSTFPSSILLSLEALLLCHWHDRSSCLYRMSILSRCALRWPLPFWISFPGKVGFSAVAQVVCSTIGFPDPQVYPG